MWELLPLNGIHLIYSKLPYSIIFHSKGSVSAISFFYILYSNIKKAVNLHLYHSCSSDWNIFYIFFVARKWRYFIMKLNLILAKMIFRLVTAYFTLSQGSPVSLSLETGPKLFNKLKSWFNWSAFKIFLEAY